MCPDLRSIAHALGGDVSSGQVIAPGPGHSPRDRSMSLRFDPHAPDGFVVTSFAGDDWKDCKAHVRRLLGLEEGTPRPRIVRRPAPTRDDEARVRLARWLWGMHRPVAGSVAERYLREARGYGGAIPATLGFLPARGRQHAPALVAAYGFATEPEPGVLTIDDTTVQAVHLVRLKPDGSGKADVAPKISIGRPRGVPIMLAPANDGLALAVAEGIENALSIHNATGVGAWASGGRTFLPALAAAVSPHVELVWVIEDPEQDGVEDARRLAHALRARGVAFIVVSGGAA